jgi:hypothetical protein
MTMPSAETLARELLNLRRDLLQFRITYLPVLLRSASPDLLQRWQATARELAQALPREGENWIAALVEEPVLRLLQDGYSDEGCFLRPPPDPFELVGGRLCWHIYPYLGQGAADREEQVRIVLRRAGAGDERAAAPWVELRRVLPAVKKSFLAVLPILPEMVLPVLAELDPAFAAQALDRGRLVAAVESNPALTPEERLRQRGLLNTRFYASWLCYSLAMVLEALANNHFAEIARFLTFPDIHADSYWGGLMPKILLATLYRKVVVLRELARKIPPARGRPAAEGGSRNYPPGDP